MSRKDASDCAMKHDARFGWCACGERHNGKLPHETQTPQARIMPKRAKNMAVVREPIIEHEEPEEANPLITFTCPLPRLE